MNPTFYTPRLRLRCWHADDASVLAMAVTASQLHLQTWLDWAQPDYGLDQAQQFIAASQLAWEQGRGLALGIFAKMDGRLLGSVGLSDIDHARSSANLGYWIGVAEQGQGYVREAVAELLRQAHQQLAIDRVELVIHPQNTRSLRLAQALGLKLLGLVPRRLALHGSLVDAIVYWG